MVIVALAILSGNAWTMMRVQLLLVDTGDSDENKGADAVNW